jgi:hypothetical protein
MSSHDVLGPIELDFSVDRSHKEAEIRSFIWAHWLENLPGIVTVIDYTKEGDKITTAYNIEPDEAGHWRVRATSEAAFREHPGTRAHKARNTYLIYSLRRVTGHGATKRTLSKTDNVPSTMYRLALIDVKGEEIGQL